MTNPRGRFGIHGGQYIPETLMNAVIELEQAYDHFKNDPAFNRSSPRFSMTMREDRPDSTMPRR